jgi:hypothetical protein
VLVFQYLEDKQKIIPLKQFLKQSITQVWKMCCNSLRAVPLMKRVTGFPTVRERTYFPTNCFGHGHANSDDLHYPITHVCVWD